MKYAALGIIIGFLIGLLFCKSCDGKVTVVDNHVRDSLLYAKIDSLKAKITIDSLAKNAERLVDDSDRNFWLDDKQETEDALKQQVVMLTFERNKFRTASEGKDTSAAMQACRDYMTQAQDFYAKGLRYKTAFDSIVSEGANRRAIDSSERVLNYATIGQDGIFIDTLKAHYNTADSSLKKVSQLYLKANKRFAIGPYLGITYDGKFKPGYGIALHYDLFKFNFKK